MKKLMLCFASGLVIFAITWLYVHSYLTTKAEERFYENITWLRAHVFHSIGDASSIVMINTANDIALIHNGRRNFTVANRHDLIRLLTVLKEQPNNSSFVVLDLDFTDPFSIDPRVDDSLNTVIRNMSRVIIPVHIKKGKMVAPVIHAKYGAASYQTYGSGLNKFKLYREAPALPSVPLLLLQEHQKVRYHLQHGLLWAGGRPCLNYIWPEYYLKGTEADTANKAQIWSLEGVLQLAAILKGKLPPEYHNKIFFVGNFNQKSSSSEEGLPGAYSLANVYLSLVAGQHYINWFWMIMVVLVFSVLSYFSWYASLPTINLPFHFLFSGKIAKWINGLISYGFILTLISAASILLFGQSVNVLIAAPIFSIINYFSFKKYKQNEAE